jgi:hypothetical protein
MGLHILRFGYQKRLPMATVRTNKAINTYTISKIKNMIKIFGICDFVVLCYNVHEWKNQLIALHIFQKLLACVRIDCINVNKFEADRGMTKLAL